MNFEEFNTDSIVIFNGTFLVSCRIRVADNEGNRVWHFYGTPVPDSTLNGIPTEQHDAWSLQLADFSSTAYDLVRQLAMEQFTPTE